MGVFDTVWHWSIRLVVRFLQVALCLASLVLLGTGFATGTFSGQEATLGGHYVMVTSLLAFLGMIYALWYLVLIELFHISPRPRIWYADFMDLVVSLCLLVAAIVLLLSDFVANCLAFGNFLRCTNLNAAVVVLFVSAASFLLTPWLMHRWRRQERRAQRERERQQPQGTPRDTTYQPVTTPQATYQPAATPQAMQAQGPEQHV